MNNSLCRRPRRSDLLVVFLVHSFFFVSFSPGQIITTVAGGAFVFRGDGGLAKGGALGGIRADSPLTREATSTSPMLGTAW